ncbi:unnamed protein product [Effrenium voratum]|nr:unnamed protein product [Effrenium voratum]
MVKARSELAGHEFCSKVAPAAAQRPWPWSIHHPVRGGLHVRPALEDARDLSALLSACGSTCACACAARPTLLTARSAAQADIVGQGALAQLIMGHVDGRKVARKVAHDAKRNDELWKEFEILKLVGGHPNIVQVIEFEARLVEIDYAPAKVIAEIGCNHQGSKETAKLLLTLAKDAGATVGKFQKRSPQELLTPEQYNAPHPAPHNSYGNTYGAHREFLELSLDDHRELQAHCQSIGIEYSCSVWDATSAKEIASLRPSLIKVGSPSNTNWELQEVLRDSYEGEVHISTGMTTEEELEKIIEFWEKGKGNATSRVVLYTCTSAYPAQFEDTCLLQIRRFQERYGRRVKEIGFSGHHLGIAIDIAAYVLGARWIERHFTKDRTWKGTDHAASLEPPGLAKLVRDLGATYTSLQYKDGILDVEKEQRNKLKWGCYNKAHGLAMLGLSVGGQTLVSRGALTTPTEWLGSVIIITNSAPGWVDQSCQIFMPQILPQVRSYPIFAKPLHAPLTFKMITTFRRECKKWTNLISIGDGDAERAASLRLQARAFGSMSSQFLLARHQSASLATALRPIWPVRRSLTANV